MSKQLARKAIYHLASWEPLYGLVRERRLRNRVAVLMYHELAYDKDDVESWTVVRRSDFMRQMEYLCTYFDIVSLPQAIACMTQPEQSDRPMVVVTFDDGDRGNHDVLLPIVREMSLPVTIFIATRQVQDQRSYWFDRLINALQVEVPITISLPGVLSDTYVLNETRGAGNWAKIELLLRALKQMEPAKREQAVDIVVEYVGQQAVRPYRIAPLTIHEVKKLAECPLVTIGAHSHCHNILTQLGLDDAMASVAQSKRLLELWSEQTVGYFAYPNGDFNNNVISAVASAGFEVAVTTRPCLWERNDRPLLVPRIGVGRYDSLDVFKVKLVGGLEKLLN